MEDKGQVTMKRQVERALFLNMILLLVFVCFQFMVFSGLGYEYKILVFDSYLNDTLLIVLVLIAVNLFLVWKSEKNRSNKHN